MLFPGGVLSGVAIACGPSDFPRTQSHGPLTWVHVYEPLPPKSLTGQNSLEAEAVRCMRRHESHCLAKMRIGSYVLIPELWDCQSLPSWPQGVGFSGI